MFTSWYNLLRRLGISAKVKPIGSTFFGLVSPASAAMFEKSGILTAFEWWKSTGLRLH
jgi:hypothetical protein